jgi:hypothetical protein
MIFKNPLKMLLIMIFERPRSRCELQNIVGFSSKEIDRKFSYEEYCSQL